MCVYMTDFSNQLSAQLPAVFHRAGENVLLNCPLTQPNLLWLFDNRFLIRENERRMFVCDNNAGLIIRNVSIFEDNGIYLCAIQGSPIRRQIGLLLQGIVACVCMYVYMY